MKKKIRWTEEIVKYIIKIHKGKTLYELADMVNKQFNLNVTNKDIGNLKARLRIKKGIILDPAVNEGKYKSGKKAANKGKKWCEFMSKEGQENSKKTWFKKRSKPHNALPIGTKHIRSTGYLYIKVADGKGNNNWIPKHKYIYEQHYGKIPEKSKVIFADGNRFNFDIENLILVSNSEELIMNRKKMFSSNKEITKTGSLIAKVIDKKNNLKNKPKK